MPPEEEKPTEETKDSKPSILQFMGQCGTRPGKSTQDKDTTTGS